MPFALGIFIFFFIISIKKQYLQCIGYITYNLQHAENGELLTLSLLWIKLSLQNLSE